MIHARDANDRIEDDGRGLNRLEGACSVVQHDCRVAGRYADTRHENGSGLEYM